MKAFGLAWMLIALLLAGCGGDGNSGGSPPTTGSSSESTLPDRSYEGTVTLAIGGDAERRLAVECTSLVRSMTFRAYDEELLLRFSLIFSDAVDQPPQIGLLELDSEGETYFLEGAQLAIEDPLGRRGRITASGTLSSGDVGDSRAVSVRWECS